MFLRVEVNQVFSFAGPIPPSKSVLIQASAAINLVSASRFRFIALSGCGGDERCGLLVSAVRSQKTLDVDCGEAGLGVAAVSGLYIPSGRIVSAAWIATAD